MKDIVEKILKEEEKASKIVQGAKEDADHMVREAKKEKEDIVNQAILQAEASAQKQKEEAEKSFISEKESVLKEARRATLAIREKKEKEIQETSRKVFSRVITVRD